MPNGKGDKVTLCRGVFLVLGAFRMAWGVEHEGFLVVVNEFCEQLFGGSEIPRPTTALDV